MKKELAFLIIVLTVCSILFQIKAQGGSTAHPKLESMLPNSTSSVESEIPAFDEIQPATNPKMEEYSWPMFRHNPQHTGYTEDPGPDKGELIWRHKTDNWIVSSPCVVDGRVYVGSIPNYSIQINQTIGFGTPIFYCLDADTGNLIWEAEIDFTFSSPAVMGDKVYVGTFNGSVYCLDADTGTIKWKYATGDAIPYLSPTVVNNMVYVGSDDGYIYCLNANFGSLVWKFWIDDSPCPTPTVTDGKVYVGDEANDIYCLDAYTGSIVWKSHVFSFSGFYSTPAVIDGKVYIASSVGICCLDADTGDHIWDYRTENWSSSSSPAVAYGNVYIGSEHRTVGTPRVGCIYCLDGDTGELKWIYEVGGAVTSSPAVASGMVYVGSIDNYVYCLNAYSGNLVWKYETGGGVESSPAVAYGKVYIGSKDGYIYCLGTHARRFSTTAIIEFIKSCQSSEGGFYDPYPYVTELLKIPNLYSTYFAIMALKALNSQPKDVNAAIKFLKGKQDPYGGFFEVFPYLPSSYPSNSTVISTHHAVVALKALGSEPDNVEATVHWLRACQEPEGYFTLSKGRIWPKSLEFSCYAILALDTLGSRPEFHNSAIKFIQSAQTQDGYFRDPIEEEGYYDIGLVNYLAIKALKALGSQPDRIDELENWLKLALKRYIEEGEYDIDHGRVRLPESYFLVLALQELGSRPDDIKNVLSKLQSDLTEYLDLGCLEVVKTLVLALNALRAQIEIPVTESKITNVYETDNISTFFSYLFHSKRAPIDCIIDVYVSGDVPVDRVYLKLIGVSPDTVQMSKKEPGHYCIELLMPEEFSAEDMRDVAFFILKLMFSYFGYSLAPPPWSYSEPISPEVTLSEIVVVDVYSKEYSTSVGTRLPTYRDAINKMLPRWSYGRGEVISAMSPVDILIIDSEGRRVGALYENGNFIKEVNEVPDAFYTGRNFTPEFIYVPQPIGNHAIKIIGIGTGRYYVSILAFQNNKGSAQTISGESAKGVVREITVSTSLVHEKMVISTTEIVRTPWYQQYWYVVATICIIVSLSGYLIYRKRRKK